MIKTVGKSILLLLAGGFAGAVLLTLAYLLPVNTVNRDASFEILDKEGWYPRASMSLPTDWEYLPQYIPDKLDGFTDGVMLQTALNSDRGNLLIKAMASYSQDIGEYAYYWHGYVSILRPLLFVFDISELRMFNGMCQLAVMFGLCFLIGREKGKCYVGMLLASYLLLMPMTLAMSLQYSWVFYIATISTLVLLCKRDFFVEKNRYIYFFVVVGMLTSYLDLLTYPLFTWGMPLVWWLVMHDEQRKSGRWCREVVFSGFSWIAGYAGMWILKWLMASAILGRNIVQSAINEVFYRSGASEGSAYELADRFQASYTNWLHYGQTIYVIVLVAVLLYWVWKTLRYGWHGSAKGCAYLLICLSSFVWYFVLVNHTLVHHVFTYRIFGVTLLAVFALINDGVARDGTAGLPLKEMWRICTVWVAALLLAFSATMLTKEVVWAMNGAEQFRQILLPQGSVVEVTFTPTFNRIKNLGLGLESLSTKGQYEISLWDGERLKYQVNIPIEDMDHGHFRQVAKNWRLKHGKTYRLTISVQDNCEDVYLWVTTVATTLTEYGELYIAGEAVEGQIFTSIDYNYRPLSIARLLFLTISWTGLFAAAGFTFFFPFLQKKKNLSLETVPNTA